MNTELLGVIAQIVLMMVLSYPLGKYIAKVYKGKKVWSDFMKPLENLIFRLSGINPEEEMNWKQFLRACKCILVCMGYDSACYARLLTSESGWEYRSDRTSGFQYLYFFYGKL